MVMHEQYVSSFQLRVTTNDNCSTFAWHFDRRKSEMNADRENVSAFIMLIGWIVHFNCRRPSANGRSATIWLLPSENCLGTHIIWFVHFLLLLRLHRPQQSSCGCWFFSLARRRRPTPTNITFFGFESTYLEKVSSLSINVDEEARSRKKQSINVCQRRLRYFFPLTTVFSALLLHSRLGLLFLQPGCCHLPPTKMSFFLFQSFFFAIVSAVLIGFMWIRRWVRVSVEAVRYEINLIIIISFRAERGHRQRRQSLLHAYGGWHTPRKPSRNFSLYTNW